MSDLTGGELMISPGRHSSMRFATASLGSLCLKADALLSLSGVFNAGSLLQGNNALCFGYQAIISLVPKIITNLVSDVNSVLGLLTSRLDPIMGQLNCPGAATFNEGLLSSVASGQSLL